VFAEGDSHQEVENALAAAREQLRVVVRRPKLVSGRSERWWRFAMRVAL
jgi:hypothetical protein